MSSTFFGIYIDKLEGCFEEAGCVALTLANIVIILLIYIDDIILMVRSPYDLDKQLRILKEFCYIMGMLVNTIKTKVMKIKSKRVTYTSFLYKNNNLEEYERVGFHI